MQKNFNDKLIDDNNPHIYKNKKYNLVPLCQKCHDKVDVGKIIIRGYLNTSKGITLPKGEHIIRLKVILGPFNLNWFSFDDSESLGLPVPGKIEAEDYVRQEGVTFLSQSNSDIQYIGYLDSADYTDYIIDVKKSGIYDLSYRVASDGNQSYANGGKIELQC